MGNGVDRVTLIEKWVFEDLSSSAFTRDHQRKILADIDDLEADLTTWNRPLTKCFSILSNTGSETIYRRRVGDLRSYFVRRKETMYCIGVGKRKNTYERDLDRIIERARRR